MTIYRIARSRVCGPGRGPVYCLTVEFYLWRRKERLDGLQADT